MSANRSDLKRRKGAGWTLRFLGVAAVFGLFLLQRARSNEKNHWVTAEGIVRGTQVVPDHALETKWGSEVSWKAQYRVLYIANGREFTVWVDSGIQRGSKAEVELAIPKSYPTCSVDYKPSSPEASFAKCR